MRSLLTIALALFISTAAAAQDVPAQIIALEFSCRIGVTDPASDPTTVPALSVQLFRADAPGFTPICVDMAGALDVLVGFTLPYVEGVVPEMKAFAFSVASCSGLQSPESANACLVTHLIAAPEMLP